MIPASKQIDSEDKAPYSWGLEKVSLNRDRTMRYQKDRINESFDDYFPCRKRNVN